MWCHFGDMSRDMCQLCDIVACLLDYTYPNPEVRTYSTPPHSGWLILEFHDRDQGCADRTFLDPLRGPDFLFRIIGTYFHWSGSWSRCFGPDNTLSSRFLKNENGPDKKMDHGHQLRNRFHLRTSIAKSFFEALQIDQLSCSSKHFVPKMIKFHNLYFNHFLKNFHESSRGSLIL